MKLDTWDDLANVLADQVILNKEETAIAFQSLVRLMNLNYYGDNEQCEIVSMYLAQFIIK